VSQTNKNSQTKEIMELKSTDEIYRSKLYMLNKDNEWINQALGMPSIENSLVYPHKKYT